MSNLTFDYHKEHATTLRACSARVDDDAAQHVARALPFISNESEEFWIVELLDTLERRRRECGG